MGLKIKLKVIVLYKGNTSYILPSFIDIDLFHLRVCEKQAEEAGI